MTRLVVKICGLTDAGAVAAALGAGADMLGFVAFAGSPRHVSPERAAALAASVAGRARKVLLTVDADDAALGDMVTALAPDLLQLHGRESPARAAALRARFGLPVIKALGVASAADLAGARDYAGAVDWLLFDARPPPEATRPGGNGRAFDWTILSGFDPGLPFLLSGGLDAGNVAAALTVARPRGVDASSGVESAPGVKDPVRIADFVRAARRG